MARVETDAGIQGVGESFVFDPEGSEARMVARGIDALADRIVGEDPRDVVARWHEMYTDAKRSTAYRALSAIDEALWDVKGKDADKPLYRLLGGEVARSRPTPPSRISRRPSGWSRTPSGWPIGASG